MMSRFIQISHASNHLAFLLFKQNPLFPGLLFPIPRNAEVISPTHQAIIAVSIRRLIMTIIMSAQLLHFVQRDRRLDANAIDR